MPKGIIASAKLVLTDWSGVVSDDRRQMKRQSYEDWIAATPASAIEFCRTMGIEGDATVLHEEYRQTYEEVRCEGLHPKMYPDARDFFAGCQGRGQKIVVISTHPTTSICAEAREYELEGYIDDIMGSVPDKSLSIQKARAKYDDCVTVYLGDMTHDIRAAKKAGVSSIAVATGYHHMERLMREDPDLLVLSLTALGIYMTLH